MPEESQSPLTLFLEYEYLPVIQQAALLSAIDGIYEAILPKVLISPEQFFMAWNYEAYVSAPPWEQRGRWFRPIFGPPLCIVSCTTEHSITVKFDIERKWIPRIVFKKGDLEILIPRWTAAVLLVGAAVTYGVGEYQSFLEVQKTQLEIDKLQIEIEQLQLERIQKDPRVELYRQEFRLQTSAPNIQRIEVNGVPVDRAP